MAPAAAAVSSSRPVGAQAVSCPAGLSGQAGALLFGTVQADPKAARYEKRAQKPLPRPFLDESGAEEKRGAPGRGG